jgi:hypothetical protein
MPRNQKLCSFLASFVLRRFCETAIMRLETGEARHPGLLWGTLSEQHQEATMKRWLIAALCVLVAGCEAQAPTPTDFLTAHIANQARELEGSEIADARQVVRSDLDGDGQDELVVVYFIAGPFGHNDVSACLAVFKRHDDQRYYLIHTSYIGNRGWRHIERVKKDKGVVLVEALEFAGGEPLSSPSVKVVLEVAMPEWQTVVVTKARK